MRKTSLAALMFFLVPGMASLAQESMPTDYLSPSFHAGRREALRKIMPDSSVVVVFAYPVRNFSNDVDYVYHPNPDLYYLSGYKEPHSILFIFKSPQTIAGKTYKELLFIQKRDPRREQWTGKRMGVARVESVLGFDTAFNGEDFRDFPLDFSGFRKILFDGFPQGMTDNPSDPADLYNLVQEFRQKAGIPDEFDNYSESILGVLAAYTTADNLQSMLNYIKRSANATPSLLRNPLIQEFMKCRNAEDLASFKSKLAKSRINTGIYNKLLASLREIKTPEEMALLRKSVQISSIAHAEVMKAMHPGMSEREIQGIQEYIHKRYGAENVGYPSIVGAGENGCTLHYEENSKLDIGKDMVLMDVGAEYHGYSADVTRTIPANGKFTADQKAIYNLVYKAQEAIFKMCKEGTPFRQLNKTATEVLADGLVRLGIIKSKEEVTRYYPHGCSHFLGLDVHDAGDYSGNLKPEMVITVEPGIYIPPNSPCDKKWWGIAVRIEDDVRIGKDDCEILSAYAPRKASDIEKLMAEPSALDEFQLPPLPPGRKAF